MSLDALGSKNFGHKIPFKLLAQVPVALCKLSVCLQPGHLALSLSPPFSACSALVASPVPPRPWTPPLLRQPNVQQWQSQGHSEARLWLLKWQPRPQSASCDCMHFLKMMRTENKRWQTRQAKTCVFSPKRKENKRRTHLGQSMF